jgi:hypothetical protein
MITELFSLCDSFEFFISILVKNKKNESQNKN